MHSPDPQAISVFLHCLLGGAIVVGCVVPGANVLVGRVTGGTFVLPVGAGVDGHPNSSLASGQSATKSHFHEFGKHWFNGLHKNLSRPQYSPVDDWLYGSKMINKMNTEVPKKRRYQKGEIHDHIQTYGQSLKNT